jgi:hypothetical protein
MPADGISLPPMLGTSGKCRQALGGGHRKGAQFALAKQGQRLRDRIENDLHLSGEQIGHGATKRRPGL